MKFVRMTWEETGKRRTTKWLMNIPMTHVMQIDTNQSNVWWILPMKHRQAPGLIGRWPFRKKPTSRSDWNYRPTTSRYPEISDRQKKKELTFFIVAHQWMMIYADDYRARPAPVGAPSVFWKSFKNTRQPIAVTYLNMSREANIRKADGDVSQNEVVLPRERDATSQSLTSLMACIDSLSRASSSLDCSSCCCRLSSSRWSWLTSWSRSAWATSWTRRNWSACRCSNCLF